MLKINRSHIVAVFRECVKSLSEKERAVSSESCQVVGDCEGREGLAGRSGRTAVYNVCIPSLKVPTLEGGAAN
jgi:hypothetical protein